MFELTKKLFDKGCAVTSKLAAPHIHSDPSAVKTNAPASFAIKIPANQL
jgi:hypothetical protein